MRSEKAPTPPVTCFARTASLQIEQQNIERVDCPEREPPLHERYRSGLSREAEEYEVNMNVFYFQCPNTGYLVKGATDRRDDHAPIRCDACGELHTIDRESGHVLGHERERLCALRLGRRFG
jgi:hypothetical protein